VTTQTTENEADIALEALEDFIRKFNVMIQQSDEQAELINDQAEQIRQLELKNNELILAKNEAEGYKRQVKSQAEQIETMESLLLAAEKNAKVHAENSKQHKSVVRELQMARTKNQELSKQLSTLKGGDNPKKLREQIKRIKEKSETKDKRITRLETENKQYRHEASQHKQRYDEALAKIKSLNMEKSNIDFTGIYHNGDHHLILWPQVNTIRGEDGSEYQCRSLLWMHQSGTGKLITFDKSNMASMLCKPPKGGAKMPAAVRQFADDWLFNVNVTQNGVVTPDDLQQTNLN